MKTWILAILSLTVVSTLYGQSDVVVTDPAGDQMITLNPGFFQKFGSTSSYSQFDSNGNYSTSSGGSLSFPNLNVLMYTQFLPTSGPGENVVILGGSNAATSAQENNLIGWASGFHVTTAQRNVCNGWYTCASLSSGIYNAFTGALSGYGTSSGGHNTGDGYETLANAGVNQFDSSGTIGIPEDDTCTGFECGYWVGNANSSGASDGSTGTGAYAIHNASNGIANGGFGRYAGYFLVSGSQNLFQGDQSAIRMVNGTGNTLHGALSGYDFGSDYHTLSKLSLVGTTVTITTDASSLNPAGGDQVSIGGTINMNGVFTTASASSTQFTFTYTGNTLTPTETNGYWMKTSEASNYNTFDGYSTGRGIVAGSNNTIVGARVTGLPANLSNNIIFADGNGGIKAQWDGTNWTFQGARNSGNWGGNFQGTIGGGNVLQPASILGSATQGIQIPFGASSGLPVVVGLVESSGCWFTATNAWMNTVNVDSWHQVVSTSPSGISVQCPNGTSAKYHAAVGTADAGFTTFWGTATSTTTATDAMSWGSGVSIPSSSNVPSIATPTPSGTCTANGYITANIGGTTVHLATCN